MARPVAYRLDSTWRLAAPTAVVWRRLSDPAFTWPTWWPLLATQDVDVRTGPDGEAVPGACTTLRVRSPFGRALSLTLELTDVQHPGPRDDDAAPGEADIGHADTGHAGPGPGHANLAVGGDLCGTALVVVRPAVAGTVVALRWDVTPAPSRPDLAVSPRLSASAHALVMRAGELGLRRHLRCHLPSVSVPQRSAPHS